MTTRIKVTLTKEDGEVLDQFLATTDEEYSEAVFSNMVRDSIEMTINTEDTP